MTRDNLDYLAYRFGLWPVLHSLASAIAIAGFVASIIFAAALITAPNASAHVCIGSHETMCKHHD